MLAWLLRREHPIPITHGPSGDKILGQLRGNSHLRTIYATPCGVGVTRIREYLDGLQIPRLTEAQSEELEVSLDDLVEVLRGIRHKAQVRKGKAREKNVTRLPRAASHFEM
ncbi:hypothetical protein NDU88_003906 [Pleurodeles waltl]|uniref:Uncharacterized protein n=1 Tax=Pleurodeles waltl TaxID=8319 RepID=A0AAV7M6P5_PLEWA|nr:hypothetical protein NDU88_003906 [Pleurodeles waltl]